MKKYNDLFRSGAFALAALSILSVVSIMTGLQLFKGEVFMQRETFSGGEMLLAAAFLSVALFNVVSLGWLIAGLQRSLERRGADLMAIAMGVLCMVLLLGEKTMIDEIAREHPLGWEVLGEWIILYSFLVVQLVYSILVLLKSRRHSRGGTATIQGSPSLS